MFELFLLLNRGAISNPTFLLVQDWTQIYNHTPYKERSLCFLPHRVWPLCWSNSDISGWPAFLGYDTIGHTSVSSLSSLWRESTHTARVIFSRFDFPGSPGQQSLRSRCISNRRIARGGHKIFRKPWHHDNADSSFEPPIDFLELASNLIRSPQKVNTVNKVFY